MPQSSAQEPGPRGSPQAPQGSGLDEAQDALSPTANADICFSTLAALQDGQVGTVEPWTSSSNRWRHSWQTYSKIGMLFTLLFWN